MTLKVDNRPGFVQLERSKPSKRVYGLWVVATLGLMCSFLSPWALVFVPLWLVRQPYQKVLAVRQMGLQLSSPSGHQFIPAHDILDVLINEVFEGHAVVHVLQVLVADASECVVVLRGAPLAELEVAYRLIKTSLNTR